MKEKKSFILYRDALCVLDDLTDAQAGKLFKAIRAHHENEAYDLEPLVKMAFVPIKNQFDRDSAKYAEMLEKRAIAGKKGGYQKQANLASASKSKQDLASLADTDTVNDTGTVNENGIGTTPSPLNREWDKFFGEFETKARFEEKNRLFIANLLRQVPVGRRPDFLTRCDQIQKEIVDDGKSRYGAENLIKEAMQTIDQKPKSNDPITDALSEWAKETQDA